MDSSLERMEDLLVKRSLEGLTEAESAELRLLSGKFPRIDTDAFDRAVAAISVARMPHVEEMPADLYADIEAIGMKIASENKSARPGHAVPRSAKVLEIKPLTRQPPRSRSRTLTGGRPWLVAAASVALGIVAWWPGFERDPVIDLATRRAALISGGARLEAWSATEDAVAAGASGDIVWSGDAQEGYMRLIMLSTNDPRVFQYQLWIFDADRDERYPVDGGVFDVPPGTREIIVPIRVNLPIGNAALFAITVEQPGGVVVSDRDRIALLADFS